MSQENVEIVKRAIDAWARRDVEALLACMDPTVEMQTAVIGGAEGNMYRGHQGVRHWMAEVDAAFGELSVEPEEFRDAGHDVVMLGQTRARGRGSGVQVDSPIAWIYTLRAGKIVRGTGYLDWQKALKAVGLEE